MSADLHHLSAVYSIDALDPLESRRFGAHLASCGRCRSEVAQLRAAAARLGEAVAQAPPAHLRDRVRTRIATTPQVPAHTVPGHRSSWTRARRPVAVTAAASVLALVAAAGLLPRDTTSEPDGAEHAAVVLSAPDARDAVLHGSTGGPVRVVWSTSQRATVVVATDLPPAAPGHGYELWTFTPEGPVSAGVFGPGPDGHVEARLELPADEVDGWGVTVEPTDGGPEPEGELVLRTA